MTWHLSSKRKKKCWIRLYCLSVWDSLFLTWRISKEPERQMLLQGPLWRSICTRLLNILDVLKMRKKRKSVVNGIFLEKCNSERKLYEGNVWEIVLEELLRASNLEEFLWAAFNRKEWHNLWYRLRNRLQFQRLAHKQCFLKIKGKQTNKKDFK